MRITTKGNKAMYYVGFEDATFSAETSRWPSNAQCTYV